MALTRRQREIYDFVCAFIDEQGYSPSLEEIGARFGLSSVATVHKHVHQLVGKGWLRKSWNRARSLEPAGEEGVPQVTLPLLGTVAAGTPIEPIEIEERVAVPAGLVRRPDACFALRVRGDSMIDEQIRDGDTVVVERRAEARDGDTVVAVLRGEEATLKRFQRRGATVRLLPANARMKPIEAPARDVEIRGVVRALLRRY
ncbi:MAG: transcriptional repressor LexA [Deltaproteobacteria bacterium]|nr:transcriptional repressor LexA [Deltaproteobacteria bacterium]